MTPSSFIFDPVFALSGLSKLVFHSGTLLAGQHKMVDQKTRHIPRLHKKYFIYSSSHRTNRNLPLAADKRQTRPVENAYEVSKNS